MAGLDPTVWLGCGAAIGVLFTWFVLRGKAAEAFRHGEAEGRSALESELAVAAERVAAGERALAEARAASAALDEKLAKLVAENSVHLARQAELATRLEEERKGAAEKIAALQDVQRQLSDTFKALSAQSLRDNNQSFLELARATFEKLQEGARGDLDGRAKAIESLVKPLQESLSKVQLATQEIEKTRAVAYTSLHEQIKNLAGGNEQLQLQTAKLVQALRAPQARGRWGEMQLKRVLELAGMVEHCDFIQQVSMTGEDGRLRPDLVVRMPDGKSLIVDAKVPLQSYLLAMEATDEAGRQAHLKDHARQIRSHLQQLGSKAYVEEFRKLGDIPDFVVLFLPGEVFFSAALEQDPDMIEYGMAQNQKVILATPTTLIALLRTVAYGWQQRRVADGAAQIAAQGYELYKRLGTLVGHFSKMRQHLDNAVGSFNEAVGTLERRVLPAARKLKESGASEGLDDLAAIDHIEQKAKALQSDELLKLGGSGGSAAGSGEA